MALPRTVQARLSCLLHRVPPSFSASNHAVQNQFFVRYQKRRHASTAADDIAIAETTADKREKHVHDQDGGSYGETRERFISPELLPPMGTRSKLKDYLERQDCFERRKVIQIPEFYAGTIMAVTTADMYAKGKTSRFVGICTRRGGFGLGATFVLRNVINEQGVEICYELYSPLIQKIEVLKLEKRLDSDLKYLQDALPEYCTIDPNMVPIKHPPGKPVPVNPIKVKLKPKPWYKRWEREELLGIDLSFLTEKHMEHAKLWWLPEYKRMDLLQHWKLPERVLSSVEKELQQHESEIGSDKNKR